MNARSLMALHLLLSVACGRSPAPPDTGAPELPSAAVTRWTDRTELFVEHPVLIVGRPARFAIHFTDLHTFKPLTVGRAVVTLAGAKTETFATERPTGPGIFGVTVTPTAAGRVAMRIEVAGPTSDRHDLGQVEVFASETAARAGTKDEPEPEGVPFLKEQQWSLEFATTPAARRTVRHSLEVPGEVRPRAGGDALVTAPISGRVVRVASTIVLGAPVAAGAPLAEILPASAQASDRAGLEAERSEARARLQLAEADRARAERLAAAGAVPARRLHEAQAAEATARARADAAAARVQQLDASQTGTGTAGWAGHFVVRAPFAGVLTEVTTQSGGVVEQGAALFRVVAVDAVTIVARVPEADLAALEGLDGAEALVPGSDAPLHLSAPLSRGRVLDPVSRTLPVVFGVTARRASITVGQRLTVRLRTGGTESATVIPVSAIVDDAGRPVVFVQIAGETFARRPVTAGARDGADVAVTGVSPGERVVSKGAPLIRLASMSSQVPAHGHVH